MLSENIKKIRINKGLGLNQTARKAGISGSYLSDIENGKKENPTVTTLTKIADALEVPLDYLTRKSAKAMIEDKLEELNVTFEELSDKTNVPITFFDNLNSIIPDEGDYERIQVIAWALDIEPTDLANALHRQEPPVYDWSKFDKEHPFAKAQLEEFEIDNEISNKPKRHKRKSSSEEYEKEQFTTPQAAMQFILKQPAIMGFGGFDANKMSDKELIDFANELLKQLKLVSYKFKK